MADNRKNVLKNYECEGQMNLYEWLNDSKYTPEYGERGCHVCTWYDHTNVKGCFWNEEYWQKGLDIGKMEYPNCRFLPDSCKIHGTCETCKYCNQFDYEIKPEYEKNLRKAIYDPVDEPNIYCTHKDGSLNRHTAYKDCEQYKFGVGLYHRQHEWDTCDRWEKDRD
jgi:hypothetical protein